ncbi:MAG: MMPL family transporter, partial [Acidimicrobiia bacterium]|nr:MMPL family transporter [Acidimicrobiia bacterium]
MYRSLGQWCFRQWKLVIGVWVLALVGVTIVAQAVGPAFDTTFEIPASESRDGFDVLNEHFGGQGSGNPGSIVFRTTPDLGVANPDVERLMTELFDYTTTLDPGLQLTSPYSENLPRPQVAQVGPQAGNIAFASLNLSLDIDQVEGSKIGREISDKADELLTEAGLADKVQVELGGAYLAGF